MVEVIDAIANKSISISLDSKLIKIWDGIKDGKLEKKQEDRVYLVDGREGSGKSFFAIQQAKYIDPLFSVDDIYFSPDKFLEAIRTAKPGKVIVFDEAFRGLSSKGSRSTVNRAIVQALMEVRQRSLIIFIVLPTIFLLEIYAACFRSEALFHIYKLKKNTNSDVRPRAFKIYNYAKKMQLYLRGKNKYFSYAFPKIRMGKGRFYVKTIDKNTDKPIKTPYETFDLAGYKAKKDSSFMSNGTPEKQINDYSQRNICIYILYKQFLKSYRKLADLLTQNGLEISDSGVRLAVTSVEKEGKTSENGGDA